MLWWPSIDPHAAMNTTPREQRVICGAGIVEPLITGMLLAPARGSDRREHRRRTPGCQNAPCPVQSEVKRWNGTNHSSGFNSCPPCREVSSQCDTEGAPNLLQRQHIPDVVYRIEVSQANDGIKLHPF